MSRSVIVLGTLVLAVIGVGLAFLAGDGEPPDPRVTPTRTAPRVDPAPAPGVLPGPPPAPMEPPDDGEKALHARWATLRDLLDSGHVIEALEIVAAIREENPAFLADTDRAALVLEIEDAALRMLQDTIDSGNPVAARKLAKALQGLIAEPMRLDVVMDRIRTVGGQIDLERRRNEIDLVRRGRNVAERQALELHLKRFGSPTNRRGRPGPGLERTLVEVANRGTGGVEPLPVPDPDETEKRRLDQLEKLRQRDAIALLDHIAAGLAWLALHQADDGRISDEATAARCKVLQHTPPCLGRGESRYQVAATALAVIAFLDFRDQDAAGLFEPTLARGVNWLLAQQKPDGSFPAPRGYSHSIALMALGQAAASTGRADLRQAVEKGLRWLAQKPGSMGGYRYRPGDNGDLSVTGWVTQALEAARIAKAEIPGDFEAGLAHFWSAAWCGDADFSYTVGQAPGQSLSPVGMLMAHILDHASAIETVRAKWADGLRRSRSRPTLYTLYYGVRYLLAVDGRLPETWNAWILDLARTQEKKGPAAGSYAPKGRWRLTMSSDLTVQTAYVVLTLEHSLYRR